MDSHEGPSIAASLERMASSGASAAEVADAVAATWRHVEASLIQVIGPRGVTALYQRSLSLASRSHPWLAAALAEGPPSGVDLAALTAAMKQQESNAAAQAGGALLQTFYTLVNNLIGASLTHRLLGFMWQTF